MTAAKGEGRGRCRKRNCQTGSSYRSNFLHDVSLSFFSCDLRETTVVDINGSTSQHQLAVMPLDLASS
jgi:hypothetical protein